MRFVSNQDFLIMLVALSASAILTRYLPLKLLQGVELSEDFKTWMNFIPVSIFAALVASDVFLTDSAELALNPFTNPLIIPSIIVFVVSKKTEHMLLSVFVGVVSVFLMQWMI